MLCSIVERGIESLNEKIEKLIVGYCNKFKKKIPFDLQILIKHAMINIYALFYGFIQKEVEWHPKMIATGLSAKFIKEGHQDNIRKYMSTIIFKFNPSGNEFQHVMFHGNDSILYKEEIKWKINHNPGIWSRDKSKFFIGLQELGKHQHHSGLDGSGKVFENGTEIKQENTQSFDSRSIINLILKQNKLIINDLLIIELKMNEWYRVIIKIQSDAIVNFKINDFQIV